MVRIKGAGLVGIACCGLVLSGCQGPVPTHETPGWAQLIDEVRNELAAIEPDPVDPVLPADPTDPADPFSNLTRTSPNAVVTDLNDLAVGQCLLFPYDENGNLVDIVQVVPCAEPHYGEVYVTGEFTEGEFSEEFDGIVNAACENEFEGYIGVDYWASELYYDYSYTSQYGWDMGLRSWRCYVVEADYENIGSLEGAQR